MRNQAGRKVENEEARAESGTGEATERQKRGSRKGRNRRLSSREGNGSGRKKAEGNGKMLEKKGTQGTGKESKHSWNGCGSEARKGERKRTAKLSTGTGKERTGNQAGENGEDRGSESRIGALRKPLGGGDRKRGKGRTEAE